MNTLKTFFFISILFACINTNANAQKSSNKAEVKIKTSAQCEMCKERIIETLAFAKGVKQAELDLETKLLTVVYNAKKTNPDNIRAAISEVGYDADDKKADEKAYAKLPDCCKKPDDKEHKGCNHDHH